MAELIPIDEKTSVAGQIQLDELEELAASGIKVIVNNRPDGEAFFGQPKAKDLEEEAARHGVAFFNLPFTMQTLTPELVAEFAKILKDADGPILAYCRTGNRSSLLWAASQVALGAPIEAVLAQAQDAGYDLRPAEQLITDLGRRALVE
ncbi:MULTISPECIES: TIGR01244 family sulfur transferase [Rhodomicrobium]|uniref:TIGR01244 family sulfur transferase n=1 Tax=Rhodomicrobium TaxID=1068 RepID=UPI001482B239|nr:MULTISPECIES: TIGR01244 family sulfur transferase [Rhodomicrobium]